MGYYSIYKIIKDIFRTIFGNKILKFTFVFLLVFFILFLFNKNNVNAVSSDFEDFFGYNYPLTENEFQYQTGLNNDYTIILPTWSYQYFDNILICFNDDGHTRTGGIWLTKGKIFVEKVANNSNTLYIRGEQGKYLYYHSLPIVSGSYTIDMSNLSYNQFSITTSGDAYSGFLNTTTYTAVFGSVYNYTSQDDIVIDDTKFIAPYFDNVTEIENGYPDGVYISRGDFSENDYLYFHLLKITYTITENNSTIYYYSPKIFALNKDSKYYHTFVGDTENQYSYYSIPRASLSLDTNSSYLYVLSNSKQSITNSVGILEKDVDDGIYDVIQSDTAGVITNQDSINDKIQNIDDTINDNTISGDTETDIEDSLNFNNQNEGLNNLNGGFFSRLTTMLSNLLGYNLAEDTSVSLPLPNSNKSIVLHSKDIYDNVTGALRLIINAFWIYIFSFYMWKFINKIYIAVSTGNILDTFSSSGEAITNDML